MIDLVIVGGGPAGLAAAYSAWQHGLRDILILERDNELGGILNQCIHNGFGLHRFASTLAVDNPWASLLANSCSGTTTRSAPIFSNTFL